MIMLKNTDKRKNPVSITFMMLLTVLTALTLLFGNSVQEVYAAEGDSDADDFIYNEYYGGLQISGYTGSDKVVTIPDKINGKSVTYILGDAFTDNTTVEKVIIKSVQFIYADAFNGCTALKEVILPRNIVSVDAYAFRNCKKLEKVEFNSMGDVSLNLYSFYGCPNITFYCIKGTKVADYVKRYNAPCIVREATDADRFDASDNEDGTVTITKYYGTEESLTIPAYIDGKKVTKIGERVFSSNDKLKTVVISEGIEAIGKYAFYNCKVLEKVQLPESLKSIEACAFASCEVLTQINLPQNLEEIENQVFSGCEKLEKLELPQSLKSLGGSFISGCKNIKKLVITESVQEDISSYTFYGSSLEYLELPSTMDTIPYGFFSYLSTLKEITFKGYVKSIISAGTPPQNLKINAYYSSVLEKFASDNDLEYNILGYLQYDKTKRVADKSGALEYDKPTIKQIKQMEAAVTSCDLKYVVEPSTKAPYAAGQLTDEYINTGITTQNYFRYIAGLPEVYADDELNTSAQYGTTLLAIADKGLSHTPSQPEGVPDDFYKKGYAATSSSNLGKGHRSFNNFVSSCMNDGGSYTNYTTVGHRRWLLSTKSKYVGYGRTGSYYATKVFDKQADEFDFDFISWPASGDFPVSAISEWAGWSIAVNLDKYMEPVTGTVKVKVTRHSDGRVWDIVSTDMPETYSECSGTRCFISPGGYGGWKLGTILVYLDDNELQGKYTVEVTGLYDLYGSDVSIKYDVNFFDGNTEDDSDDEFADDFNGFYYDEAANNWYCIAGGQKAMNYTGLWYDATVGWWYVKDGVIDFTFNGFVPYADAWWCVAGGRVCFEYTGLWNDATVGWWYVENGAINFAHNGLVPYADAWWCVAGGRVCFEYTGLWSDAAVGWWYVENGAINFAYNGLVPYAGAWWCVGGGRVCFEYTGLWYDAAVGWWYVENGGINFGYTGSVLYNGTYFNVYGGQVIF